MGVTRAGRDLAVDRVFPIPAGVVDVRQLNKEDGDFYYNEGDRAVEDNIIEFVPETPLPTPPSTYNIHEQKVRTSGDGSSVVDVTLDFPDLRGGFRIEVRMTKVPT